jgi:hypothetical protein
MVPKMGRRRAGRPLLLGVCTGARVRRRLRAGGEPALGYAFSMSSMRFASTCNERCDATTRPMSR